MVDPLKSIGIIILAAGKGKRMNSSVELPKVLVPLFGKPLLGHLLDQVRLSVVKTTPVVVIAPDLYIIRERIGPICEYAIQESQLGTGNAVLSAKQKLLKYDHVLVLYGDHPLLRARTIDALVVHHLNSGAEVTLATLRLPHFDDWFAAFDGYGRIKRDSRSRIASIVERRDADEKEREITEVNPGYYIFKASWLWSALPKLSRNNAQGEYYLTDLIAMALENGGRFVNDVLLENPEEALGVNTPEQLSLAEKIMKEKLDENAQMYVGQLPI